MNQKIVSADVRKAYDDFYLSHDEEWRLLGAKYKAKNIVEVCKGYKFKKVLEVGAGDGSILQYLAEYDFTPEMHALEISQSGLDMISSKNIKTLKSVKLFDGYHIPFGDDEFDLVILSHVLEHVEFERMLLRELKRVSKHLVIEVPRDYRYGVDKRMKHFLSYGHINLYTPSSLRFLVKSEGFELLADKISIIQPEVTEFNILKNQKKSYGLIRSMRINTEFRIKKLIMKLGGTKQKEAFANAYTILLRKTGDLDIFR